MKDSDNTQMLTKKEAVKEVEMTSKRIALLHLAYAKTLVNELGSEKGKKVILKAIKYYGKLIGEEVKKNVLDQGLETTPDNYGIGKSRDLPKYGMHARKETFETEGKKRRRSYGCVLGKLWREYDEEELGRLYCYVDLAKFMYYNPYFKLVHTKCMPERKDEECEFDILPTTEKEREDFFNEETDWTKIDRDV